MHVVPGSFMQNHALLPHLHPACLTWFAALVCPCPYLLRLLLVY